MLAVIVLQNIGLKRYINCNEWPDSLYTFIERYYSFNQIHLKCNNGLFQELEVPPREEKHIFNRKNCDSQT